MSKIGLVGTLVALVAVQSLAAEVEITVDAGYGVGIGRTGSLRLVGIPARVHIMDTQVNTVCGATCLRSTWV
jgi:hypothetical protein